MERLYRKLENYGKSDYYPFHMPGHKKSGIFGSSISLREGYYRDLWI